MGKTWRKPGAFLLTLIMLMVQLPMGVQAKEIGLPEPVAEEAIYYNDTFMDGTSANPVRVYFGNKDDLPVPWRVLAADENFWLLIASDASLMGLRVFDNTSNIWGTSSLRKFMNEELYEGFLSAERKVILVSDTSEGARWGDLENQTDKLFALSTAESENYFADNVDWEYGDMWWLRSPGDFETLVIAKSHMVSSGTLPVQIMNNNLAVRPAFRLDLDSVLFASAAGNGKSGIVGDSLESVTLPSGNTKLTIIDDESQSVEVIATTAQATQSVPENGSLSFSFKDATTGSGQFVSCIVTDNAGHIGYYGALADTELTSEGTLSIPLNNLNPGTYTLKIFGEKINDDYLTDFASTPVTMGLTIAGGTATVSNFSGTISDESAELSETPSIISLSASPDILSSEGGESSITIEGDYLDDCWIMVQAFDLDDYMFSGIRGNRDGAGKVTLTFPANESTTKDTEYIIRASMDNGSTWEEPCARVTVRASDAHSFIKRILTHQPTGITVSGARIHSGALLTVASGMEALHESGICKACDEIRKHHAESELLAFHDISLENGYQGTLDIFIPFAGTSGQEYTVLHCNNGVLESKTGPYMNGGVATTGWERLSPFAVLNNVEDDTKNSDGAADSETDGINNSSGKVTIVPVTDSRNQNISASATADNDNVIGWMSMILASGLVICCMFGWKRKR